MGRVRDWWQARKRGEKRVAATRGLRGRVYVKRDGTEGDRGGDMKTSTRPEGTISARVYRAETGEWEDLGVISKGEGG